MAAWNPDVLSPSEREHLRAYEARIEAALAGLSAEERQTVLKAAMDSIADANHGKDQCEQRTVTHGND